MPSGGAVFLITQVLSGRTNEEMDILKKTYFSLHNKDLGVTLSSELSGDFKKVIMAMLQVGCEVACCVTESVCWMWN